MGKGGKYLNKPKKKRMGVKILLIVLVTLVLLGGVAAFIGVRYMNSLLDLIPRAEIVEQSVSFEEIQDILNYNPDKPTGADAETIDATRNTISSTTETTVESIAGNH